jgi:hypothetical protein
VGGSAFYVEKPVRGPVLRMDGELAREAINREPSGKAFFLSNGYPNTWTARSRSGRRVDPEVGLRLEEVTGFFQNLGLLVLGEQPHASGGQQKNRGLNFDGGWKVRPGLIKERP